MTDYYAVLQVDSDASDAEIKKNYRRLAKKYHPDMNPGDKGAELSFKEVAEAYDVLGNSKSRSAYDRRRASEVRGVHTPKPEKQGGANIGKEQIDALFSNFFGNNPIRDGQDKTEGKVNPIDTSDLFNSYFGKR